MLAWFSSLLLPMLLLSTLPLAQADNPTPTSQYLLAMGVVSAPEYVERRIGSRESWFGWSNVCAGGTPVRPPACAFSVEFVVRTGGASDAMSKLLQTEHQEYSDLLRVPTIPWNETRLRGPVLSVAAWFSHAAVAHADALFIAKLDDDAYVHAPGLEALLRKARIAAPNPDAIYLGAMSWFHWFPNIFERSGFGWTYTMAWHLGLSCRNATLAEERCLHKGCGRCEGPFPFASGYLAVLSTPLVLALVAADGLALRDDVPRLRAASGLITRTGGVMPKVMEDIWLGSLFHRQPPSRPMTFVALSERDDNTLVSDGWGLKVTKSSLIVHVKNHMPGRQLERFLAIHAFKRASFCNEPLAVRCAVGCRAFLSRGENASMHEEDSRFARQWSSRVDTSRFCTGSQVGAAYCRVGAVTLGAGRTCPSKPRDLLKHEVLEHAMPRARELLAKTRQMARVAGL